MKSKHKKIYATSLISILLIVFLVYNLATKTYPIALVGLTPISAKYAEQAYSMAATGTDSVLDMKIVLDQLIKVKKEEQLVSISNKNIDAEFNFLTSKQNQLPFSKDNFLEFIAKPQALDAQLRIKYNSDFSANEQAYTKVQDILNQLNAGKTFDELAKTESDDMVSGQLGGDLGFVKDGQILPELFQAAQESSLGQVNKQIVVSRLGYHIIFPVETGDKDGVKYWHIKHILIKTEGYEPWLNLQLNNFKVWHLVRV